MTETLTSMIAAAREEAREVPPAEASEAAGRGALQLIIDVREPKEFGDGHVPDAVNIPRGVLELRADPASPVADSALTGARSARILVYCTKGPGFRSLLSAQTLMQMGYENVEVLAGGLAAWDEAGLAVEREQARATA